MNTNGIGIRPLGGTAPAGATAAPAPATVAQPAAVTKDPAAPQNAVAPVALDWQPVEVNLDKVDVNVPMPPMWSVGNKPIVGRTFTTWGDPHEISGDGLKFDNMQRGEFVKLMSATGDFVLQTRQDPWSKNGDATVNTAAAVKLGDDLVVYDMKNKLFQINGIDVPLEPAREVKLPNGGSVTTGGEQISLVGPKGDKVNILIKDTYIDVTGEVSADRKDGEIRGSLGAFDNDSAVGNDLLGRNSKNFGSVDNQKNLDAFLNEWRAHAGESLFARSEDLNFFNNYLDNKELVPMMKEHFNKYYDLNGDGEITKTEFLVAKAAKRALYFTDVNMDGKISSKEFSGDAVLKSRDRNNDGTLTAAEFFTSSMGWDILKDLRKDFEASEKRRAEEAAGKRNPAPNAIPRR